MFQRLFFNTFCSYTMIKCEFQVPTGDTALSCNHRLSYRNCILPFASQNTLVKTSVRHLPITHEPVTDIFMLYTNHRSMFLLFSRPYTAISSRYTNICKSQDGVAIRVTYNKCGLWDVFEDNFKIYG